MAFHLKNQGAIVTGAARGIGLAISRRFAELGAHVSGWDLNCNSIERNPLFAHTVNVDVTDETSVNQAFLETISNFKQVSILVANAGINGPVKPTWDYSLNEWQRTIDVNLTGVFLSVRPVVIHMRKHNYGRIVIMASVAGKEGNRGACAYGAAKAGAIGFAKSLSRELQPSKITVNCIAPAIAETELFHEMTPDYIAEKKALIPMERFCKLEEIADMTAWVASHECSFTSGQIFDVSGGRATY